MALILAHEDYVSHALLSYKSADPSSHPQGEGAGRCSPQVGARYIPLPCRNHLHAECEAEDLVQEMFLRAWKKLSTFEGRSSVHPADNV